MKATDQVLLSGCLLRVCCLGYRSDWNSQSDLASSKEELETLLVLSLVSFALIEIYTKVNQSLLDDE